MEQNLETKFLMKHVINLELRGYSPTHSAPSNSRIENVYNFLKQTLTTFLESSGLEWDNLLLFICNCYNIFPGSNGKESPFFLRFGHDPAEE